MRNNWLTILAISLIGLGSSASVVLSLVTIDNQRNLRAEVTSRTDVRLCNEIEKLKEKLRQQIIKSDKDVQAGKYKSLHLTQAELDLAHQNALAQLRTYRPIDCTELPSK